MEPISEIDGLPQVEVTPDSLLGNWCHWTPLSVGTIVTDEFIFEQKQFVLNSTFLTDTNDLVTYRTMGTWQLAGDTLKLTLSERPVDSGWPHRNAQYVIRMRRRDGKCQLIMEPIVYDDERLAEDAGAWLFPYEATPDEAEKNHATYREKRQKKVVLDGPYKDVSQRLVKVIPQAVGELEIPEEIFCVRLIFFDSHAPREDYKCIVRCLGERLRQHKLATEPAHNVSDALWHPTMGIAETLPEQDNGVFDADLSSNTELMQSFQVIYSLLEWDLESNMFLLRETLRRVSLMLHMSMWPGKIKRTDDFVIFPADGSNHFAGDYVEDMQKSVPSLKRKLLTERGFLKQ
ncbi:hypothetical protein [Thalassoglobus polymorphus]|uniref:Uncharacterized protein n=1 Tax=Thalassoglobus polymorphus TaxID=2527994 RepID=A0A517QL62_9PLAN|nr:hypothetical protein [Thalassoglobus polymorphus]QDT32380.1 hypothetical protein Mal48_16260 [Thalassoglobus polymorphus]